MIRLLPLVVFTLGCRDQPDYNGAFDVPAALGVLQPEIGGPFQEPIGFVGNQHGGQVALLALKQGRFLTDDPTVAFLRGNQLPTGRARVLTGLFPFAHDDGRVTVFAFDRAFREIVSIPYIVGFDADGFPVEPPATFSTPVFDDVDGSGDTPQMVDVEVKTGWTATEDWEVSFDGSVWKATGTRSGVMQARVTSGEPFVGTLRTIAFTIEGEATAGDRFTFSTDSGSVNHDAGGLPLHVRVAPDQSVAAVVVIDEVLDLPQLKLFDPAAPDSFANAPVIALEAGARPGRMAWDTAGADLFVADEALPAVWRIRFPDPTDRTNQTVERIALPWPTRDVAPLLTDVGQQVFVVPEDGLEIWSYDLAADALRDVNPWVAGPQGVRLNAPISGIEAMANPYLQLETNDDGERDFGRSVAVSLSSGRTVFADEVTACLVRDTFGPSTVLAGALSTVDYSRSFESEAPFGATLSSNLANARHVLANPCGGVARSQTWSLQFDELRQGWIVSGTRSGPQSALAIEDQRYTSDDGEITFFVASGQSPSRDGWTMSFVINEGLTSADGDQDGIPASIEVALDQPSDPLFFHYLVGPRENGWAPEDDRPHVLVAGSASDRVGRVDPQEGTIDASWD